MKFFGKGTEPGEKGLMRDEFLRSRPARDSATPKGFTLAEVMLAMVITAILLAGIYNLFGSQEKSQVLVDQMAEMNQDLRVAATMITRDMRMAGYHMENGEATSGTNPVTGGGGPVNAIEIVEGSSGAPDAIIVMYADANLLTTITSPMPSPSAELNVSGVCASGVSYSEAECLPGGQKRCFCENDLVVITDGANSSVFCVTQVQAASLKLQHNPGEGDPCGEYNDPGGHGTFPGYGSGSRLMRLIRKRYEVDLSDASRPVLRMTEGVGLNGAQPMVDYIEDLQVQPTTPNQRSYTVNLTARTRKPLPGIGGIRRKSITETVRVRNIP